MEMKYYPVNLDVRNRQCVVIGGGSVGTRKAVTLLNCGAAVTVISPEMSSELLALSEQKKIVIKKRGYETSDLSDAFLVIGATSNEALNQQIHSDAEKRRMMYNIADQPASCNFILPSIIERGDLVITVSTSGQSPAYAKKLRHSLENLFGEEQSAFLKMMGKIREKLLKEEHAPEVHKPIFEDLINSDIIDKIRRNDIEGINETLSRILGPDYRYEDLIQV